MTNKPKAKAAVRMRVVGLYRSPGAAFDDGANGRGSDGVSLRDCYIAHSRRVQSPDCYNIRTCEFGRVVPFADIIPGSLHRMAKVNGPRYIFKVAWHVIRLVQILVVNFEAVRAWAKKSLGYKPMYQAAIGFVPIVDMDNKIAGLQRRRLNDPVPSAVLSVVYAPDSPKGACLKIRE